MEKIAKSLLGKFLVRRYKGKTKAYLITDVEAYDGFKDKASHAHRGKTERNKIMFGMAGYWYIYFTYGIHWMLNIVTDQTFIFQPAMMEMLRQIWMFSRDIVNVVFEKETQFDAVFVALVDERRQAVLIQLANIGH